MNRSSYIAIGIVVVLVAYFGIRSLGRGSLSDARPEAVVHASTETPQAVFETLNAEPHPLRIVNKGRTAADKIVSVKAGTSGNVVSTPAREGSFVKAGTLLCGLDIEARAARVKEAEAYVESAKVEFEAARDLAAKGLAPANREAATKASLDAAEAALNTAKVELSKTQIRAPFDGIFETRIAEAGDFLAPGQPCGVLVDMDPVIVTVEVSETDAGRIAPGMEATARLADGRILPAKVRYVSRTASGATRTFIVEAELQTGDAIVPAGISSELIVPLGDVPATLISAGLLTLSDSGQLGIRYVTHQSTVEFVEVQVIDQSPAGTWVTGLPASANVITLGQDYLSDGVKVKPVRAGGAQP